MSVESSHVLLQFHGCRATVWLNFDTVTLGVLECLSCIGTFFQWGVLYTAAKSLTDKALCVVPFGGLCLFHGLSNVIYR